VQDQALVPNSLGVVYSKKLLDNHVNFCRFAHHAGYRWVELKYESRLEVRDSLRRDADAVKDFAARNGIGLSVHAAYDPPINIGSDDPKTFDMSVRLYRESLAYAHHVGARFLTVHGGDIQRSQYSRERYRAVMAKTVEALKGLIEHARTAGVALCLENRHRFGHHKLRFPTYASEMRACRDAIGPDLLFTIDSGHANSIRRGSLSRFVREVGPDTVGLTHLHDNDGTADSHLVPGEGTVDFDGFLRAWLAGGWRFPLLLELNSHAEFARARARLEAWLARAVGEAMGSRIEEVPQSVTNATRRE
jgi:sugar phosphate isomerase/epimerase